MRNTMITRDNPFNLIDPFFDEFFTSESNSHLNQIMRTDIVDNGDHYEVKVDMPDIKKKDIKLSLNDGYLTIEAKKEETNDESKHGRFLRRERYFGSYKRSFYLGEDVLKEDVKAKLDEGVLTLSIAKKAYVEPEESYIEIE